MASNSASISIRTYIAFLPHPLPQDTPIPYTPSLHITNPLNIPLPSEPTSTLVLTTPRSTYLDIRILKPLTPTDNEPLPTRGGPTYRLDWAFAGTSASRLISSRESDGVKHSTWHHWLDNHYPIGSPEIPLDEGDMYPVSPTLTLEFGTMYNLPTNSLQNYEEMWKDLPVLATYPETVKWAMVMKLDEPAYGVRGMVVRLGQYVQGMLKRGEEVTVERWEFVETKDGEGKVVDGEWTRVVRLGDLMVPCVAAFEPENVELGTLVTYEHYAWVVDELESWRAE
ncbi:uncharacterized protein BDR25DRAFT_127596 [Lindgomyces ingoldianus]|uniref:Uncharacterized protein n=1 Tax=Lindgomyces ingoldianus TaxID=673940 RepID=A0ACB6Q6X6_9PLEO|nr:uncharacterized protein BDR25DRAFT_127596 [Lindgomyces ingoldianus]KAF2462579.1 hypothetical protein BDR25DRAFT_127596 [Lindgomyces ingoldianus]